MPNPKNPNATDLICADCGAWQKFANADDRRKYHSLTEDKNFKNCWREPKMVSHEYATCTQPMTPDDYQKAALRTCDMLGENAPIKKLFYKMMPHEPFHVIDDLIRENRSFFELWNGLLGLNGEAGECIDIFKKVVFQGHELDKKHMAEELGDVAWYLAISAHAIGYNLEDIFKMNIEKLEGRYPDGFDPERSVHRKEYEEETK